MAHLCYSFLVFFMLSRLFVAALWPPAGKGLGSGVVLDCIDSLSLPPSLVQMHSKFMRTS